MSENMETLFPGYEPGDPDGPPAELLDPTLSAGQRLTLRQRFDVSRGIHPLTGEPTMPELGTCGDCAHRYLQAGGGGGPYPKCGRPEPPVVQRVLRSHGATTDVRRWWPACPKFTPKEEADGD